MKQEFSFSPRKIMISRVCVVTFSTDTSLHWQMEFKEGYHIWRLLWSKMKRKHHKGACFIWEATISLKLHGALTKKVFFIISLEASQISCNNSELGLLFIDYRKKDLNRWLPYRYPPAKYLNTDRPFFKMFEWITYLLRCAYIFKYHLKTEAYL